MSLLVKLETNPCYSAAIAQFLRSPIRSIRIQNLAEASLDKVAQVQSDDSRSNKPYIFISYKRVDEAAVAVIAKNLRRCGFSLWWDRGPERILPGQSWSPLIEEKLRKAAAVIVVLSPNVIARSEQGTPGTNWVLEEVRLAQEFAIPVLPVQLSAVTLPLEWRVLVSNLQIHDVRDGYTAICQSLQPLIDAQSIQNGAGELSISSPLDPRIPLETAISKSRPEQHTSNLLRLSIRTVPDIGFEIDTPFESPSAGGSTVFTPENTLLTRAQIDIEHLYRTEVQSVTFIAEVCRGSTVLASDTATVELLPTNYWAGGGVAPACLAACVLPHAESVHDLVSRAAKRQATQGGVGMVGYQQGPAAALACARTVYESLQELSIQYVASSTVDRLGHQRVRLPAEIVEHKIGNCIDLSLMMASVIEGAGMDVAICMDDRHAWLAVWLKNSDLSEPEIREASFMQNRAGTSQPSLFFIDAVCISSTQSFEEACKSGNNCMRSPKEFLAIDIHAARTAGIRPASETSRQEVNASGTSISFNFAGDLPGESNPSKPSVARPIDRALAMAIDELLDTSMRNSLINFKREKKSVLKVAATSVAGIAKVEDAFGKPLDSWFQVVPVKLLAGEDLDSTIDRDISQKRIRVVADLEPGIKTSLKLHSEAARIREESGASVLKLAVGLLEYSKDGESVLAPLILVPLESEKINQANGIRVRRSEEDTIWNVCLLEHLRSVHQLVLDDLEFPEDESGIDVRNLLSRVRERIRNHAGWVVHNEAWLLVVDNAKWPIWSELRSRKEAVTNHPVAQSILTHIPLHPSLEKTIPSEDHIRSLGPQDVCCPLPFDGSQLRAIVAAEAGCSFTLQGPPGTGKSQTIANLISHCLANGKRVLFVAEKQVALDVVARRLNDSGLKPWILNLHPEHCGRAEFVSQIKESFEVLDSLQPDRRRYKPANATGPLNDLKCLIANQHPLDHSLYSATERLAELRALNVNEVDVSATFNANSTSEQMRSVLSAARSLQRAVQGLLVLPSAHPLAELHPSKEINPGALTEAANSVAVHEEKIVDVIQKIAKALGIDAQRLGGIEPMRALFDLVRHVQASELTTCDQKILGQALNCKSWNILSPKIHQGLVISGNARTAASEFNKLFDAGILEIDLDRLLASLRVGAIKIWPLNWIERRKIRSALIGFSKGTLSAKLGDLQNAIESAIACRAKQRDAAPHRTFLLQFGEENQIQAWIKFLDLIANQVHQFEKSIAAIFLNSDPKQLPNFVAAVRTGQWPNAVKILMDSLQVVESGLLDLKNQFGVRLKPIQCLQDHVLRAARARGWVEHVAELEPWALWKSESKKMADLGGSVLVDLVSQNKVAVSLDLIAEASILRAFISILRKQSTATDFQSASEFERLIKELEYGIGFEKSRIATASAKSIKQKWDAIQEKPEASASVATLNTIRSIATRPRRSIRRLIRESAGALSALKPIVLASPMSAATHLDPSLPEFDVVVFDEASQVPVGDALGAIIRGRCTIVVGDSKQMPPTRFFTSKASTDEDESADAAVTPQESILNGFIAAGFQQVMLQWHYRSRDERLIAFSNAMFYQGNLETFPSIYPSKSRARSGVEFRFIKGVYERGTTRTNQMEAAAVVAELADCLKRNGNKSTDRSLGVVAFSGQQRDIIQELWDECVDNDAELRAIIGTLPEPILIKNLESVQGDERSTMLFSIGYGPDAEGKLHMVFGPLNSSGGERRLNVAITRARDRMVIFSSIRASDIDQSKTSATGVRLLKQFLDYAENDAIFASGTSGISSTHAGTPDHIEEQLAQSLRDRGLSVDMHIGRGKYRVSVAIRNPRNPERWIMGVEFDGLFWSSGLTASDREIVRLNVLKGLGWENMRRVWCSDWIKNPKQITDEIVKAVHEAAAVD